MKKIIKGIVMPLSAALLLNSFAFSAYAQTDENAETAEYADQTVYSYDFNDGVLPDIFNPDEFSVENGKLRVNDPHAWVEFTDVPRDCSVSFKLEPIEGCIIPQLAATLRNEVGFYYKNNAVLTPSYNNSRMVIVSSVTWSAIGTDNWVNNGTHFMNGNVYNIKYTAKDDRYAMSVNDKEIVSATQTVLSDSDTFPFSFQAAALDGTQGTTGFYIDDLVIKNENMSDSGETNPDPTDPEEPAEQKTPYYYNFNDGKLPDGFSEEYFTVEDGKLRVNNPKAYLSLSDVPKDCIAEFTIEPIDGYIIPQTDIQLRESAVFYYKNNSVLSTPYNTSQMALVSMSDWKIKGENWSSDGVHFKPGNTYKLKYMAEGDRYSMSIDGREIINAECSTLAEQDTYNFVIEVSAVGGTVGTTGFYIDNLSVRGVNDEPPKEEPDEPEKPPVDPDPDPEPGDEAKSYSYDFNDGKLPSEFSADNFTVENGMLRVNGANSYFSLSDLPKDCTVSFKLKPIDGCIIPQFVSTLRNDAGFYYKNNSVLSSPYNNSQMLLVSSSDWKTRGNDNWVNGGTHFMTGNEYDVKYTAKDNKYTMSVDGKDIVTAEYSIGELNDTYPFTFQVAPVKGTVGTVGFYIDDLKAGKAEETSTEPTEPPTDPTEPSEPEPSGTGKTYLYNFNDGNLPSEFSAENFSVENGKLRVNGSKSYFALPDIPKDCSVSFTLKPIEGCIIPQFVATLREDAGFYYKNNSVLQQPFDSSQIFILSTAKNWSKVGNDSWSNGKTHFADGGEYNIKYTVQGDKYTMYIDGKETVTAEYSIGTLKDTYPFSFMVSPVSGTVGTVGFYIDNLIVKRLDNSASAGDFKLPEIAETGETVLYNQSFAGLTDVPASANGADFKDNTVENNALTVKDSGFVVPSTYANHRFEMDVKANSSDKLLLTMNIKKDENGNGYTISYEDTNLGTDGSKWTIKKKDGDGERTVVSVTRDKNDIVTDKFSHMSVECTQTYIKVLIDGNVVAEAETGTLTGVDYSEWVSTEIAANAICVDNIKLTGYQMDVYDAIDCLKCAFSDANGKSVNSASDIKEGKLYAKANISNIDPIKARELTAMMILYKDGYMIKTAAKKINLPKVSITPADIVETEIDMDITSEDTEGNISVAFMVWDNVDNMNSCGGLYEIK